MVSVVSPAQEFTRDQCSGRLAPLREQSLTNFASQAESHRPRRRQAHSKPKQTLTQGEGLKEGFESPRFIFFTRTRSFVRIPLQIGFFSIWPSIGGTAVGRSLIARSWGESAQLGMYFFSPPSWTLLPSVFQRLKHDWTQSQLGLEVMKIDEKDRLQGPTQLHNPVCFGCTQRELVRKEKQVKSKRDYSLKDHSD